MVLTPTIFYLFDMISIDLSYKDQIGKNNLITECLQKLQSSLINGKVKNLPNYPFLQK